jgi:glycosyltransferase involved in cell wall biosynthesis
MSHEMPMRIVYVITSLSMAGAQMMLYKLLSSMDRNTFDPVVVSLTNCSTMGEQMEKLGVPVHAVGMGTGIPTATAVWRLVRIVKRSRPALIQGWQYHGNLAAQLGRIFLQHRVPVLWNIRHSVCDLADERRMTAAVIKLGARLSYLPERVIYVAQSSATQHEALGYQANKRVIIPNGFDLQRFEPCEPARRQIRTELGLSPSAIIIGMVARYHPMKDHTNFLQAAAHLLQYHSDIHFLLAGENVDRTNSVLMALVEKFGLAGKTHLLGERYDIPCIMATLDIASSASAYGEGFPNVIGEAMACGVPCTVTDVGDSAFLVGDTGRVVPPRNSTALAASWRKFIEMGPLGRAKLGILARRRIEEHFNLLAIAKQYDELYKEIIASFSSRWSASQKGRAHV